ncbi:hypothetical protein BY458DRAFT_453229, partial [Sporodiniella umbellata]
MSTESIPIIDFSLYETDPKRVAQEVFEACKTIGFFYLINHGISQEDVDKGFELSKKFFDLPLEQKNEYAIDSRNHGYSELYSERLDPKTQKQGDHKEAFNFRYFENNKPFAPLPSVFDQEVDLFIRLSQGIHRKGVEVLQIFADALKIPEEEGGREFFAKTHLYNDSRGIMRFIKYPHGGEATYKEPVRAGSHSDYGSITLLFQKDIGGLEVRKNRTEWISAPIIPGSVLINIGDQMELWTNGLFKSTQHRVTFLPEHNHLDRYSFAVFMHPFDKTLLKPVPSEFVDQTVQSSNGYIYTAGEHLTKKLDETYTYSS